MLFINHLPVGKLFQRNFNAQSKLLKHYEDSAKKLEKKGSITRLKSPNNKMKKVFVYPKLTNEGKAFAGVVLLHFIKSFHWRFYVFYLRKPS